MIDRHSPRVAALAFVAKGGLVFVGRSDRPFTAAGAVDLDNGARLYREACLPCHGPTGAGGPMPACRASHADPELRDLAAFVAERLAPANH